MTLTTSVTDGDTASTFHAALHNDVNGVVNSLETAHGLTALTLPDIYGNGSAASDSRIQVDGTRGPVEILDAATPTGANLFAVFDSTRATGYLEVDASAVTVAVDLTVSGTMSAPGSASNSEEFGDGATATGISATALGRAATASATSATALGSGSAASDLDATSVGRSAAATGEGSTAVGKSANAGTADSTTAVGVDSDASATSATAVGNTAVASGVQSSAYGQGATASAQQSTAIGQGTTASATSTLAIGDGASASVSAATAVGSGSNAQATDSTAIGAGANALFTRSVALGKSSVAAGIDSTAIGESASSAEDGVAIGSGASVTGSVASIAIGKNAAASHMNSVCIANAVGTSTDNDFILGDADHNVQIAGTLDVSKAVTMTLGTGVGLAVTSAVTAGDYVEVSHDDSAGAKVRVWNTTEDDADGAGDSMIEFRREDSGGSTHDSRITCAHDGTSTDGTSRLEFRPNSGVETNPTAKATLYGDTGNLEVTGGYVGAIFTDDTDNTKAATFDLTGITTSTTRTITVPDADLRLDGKLMAEAFGTFSLGSSASNTAFGLVSGLEITMPYDGEIIAISAAAAVTPSGAGTATIKPFVGTSDKSATLSVQLDNSNRTNHATVAAGTLTFTAGQRLNVRADTNGSWATNNVDATLFYALYATV